MDNGQGAGAQADRIHLVCTEGCDYSTGGEVGGGTIVVRGEGGKRFQAPAPLRDPLSPADPPDKGDTDPGESHDM